jgi:hypothetical protein
VELAVALDGLEIRVEVALANAPLVDMAVMAKGLPVSAAVDVAAIGGDGAALDTARPGSP